MTQKARGFVSTVNPTTIPVSMDSYLREVEAVLHVETDMEPDEAGYSIALGGKRYICVNGNDREERQRFTICHEIAHIVLGLPSEHRARPWWSAKRPLAERVCDIFAAELLLPDKAFSPSSRTPRSASPASNASERFLRFLRRDTIAVRRDRDYALRLRAVRERAGEISVAVQAADRRAPG